MTLQRFGENSHLFFFPEETFNGEEFFDKYVNAPFLKDKKNLIRILSDGWRLRAAVENLPTGDTIAIDGMFLDSDVPLAVQKSNLLDESDVPNDAFTPRRLAGLVAALAYHQQLTPLIPEAKALGLSLGGMDVRDRKLYFSAVPGAELFVKLFEEYPFVCALKRFESKLISEEYLRYVANVADDTGRTMVEHFRDKYLDNSSNLLDDPSELERRFKGEPFDIRKVLACVTLGVKMTGCE